MYAQIIDDGVSKTLCGRFLIGSRIKGRSRTVETSVRQKRRKIDRGKALAKGISKWFLTVADISITDG